MVVLIEALVDGRGQAGGRLKSLNVPIWQVKLVRPMKPKMPGSVVLPLTWLLQHGLVLMTTAGLLAGVSQVMNMEPVPLNLSGLIT